ncbi:MAG: M20/M25/M40 family metallo-hydrolase [Treponema sp.]|jgi:carboxypeptidase PM20D1|nr:M20/M25/M40 family metallo-hydrolase [Treponema sp.]
MDFIERFRAAMRIPTWWQPGALQGNSAAEAPLLRFQEFLAENYPAFHLAAERHILSPYSVIYRWPCADGAVNNKGGGNASCNTAVLILAHYDVVPAETEKWSVDPFGAEMKDGFVYGRGSLDMKSVLVSIMEAAEMLCATGFKPKRDVWFAFGGDEERTGILGAANTAKWFADRGRRFSWILDEGTPVAVNQIKGIDKPVALVSIEEKGFLSLELCVAQEPGHASMPPEIQAAAVLARALCRIAARPFPFELIPTVESFFAQIASLMRGIHGFVMRHARGLGPLFFKAAASNPAITAMLRTTVAMTQLSGSAADNVMPSEVRAVINLRLLRSWTIEKAITFIKKAVNNERVQIKIHGLGTEPVAANPDYERSGWQEIKTALAEVYPGVPMLPFLMTATTDSRHFKELADGIFRFTPHKLDPKEMSGVHGHNERISLENLKRGLQFYFRLLGVL